MTLNPLLAVAVGALFVTGCTPQADASPDSTAPPAAGATVPTAATATAVPYDFGSPDARFEMPEALR